MALIVPPDSGKVYIAQGVELTLFKMGCTAMYRSIFDAVRDFSHDEAFQGHEQGMGQSRSQIRSSSTL